MIRTAPLFALAAAALVAGCNEDRTIVAGGPDTRDEAAEALQANGPVALPPSIASTKTYRCADNTLVQVDWMSDGKSANIRAGDKGTVHVVAPEPGKDMTAEGGFALSGASGAASVRIATGGAAQSCKA